MNLQELVARLVEINQSGVETHELELTSNDGQPVIDVTVCTNKATGETVLNIELDDSERYDLAEQREIEHPDEMHQNRFNPYW